MHPHAPEDPIIGRLELLPGMTVASAGRTLKPQRRLAILAPRFTRPFSSWSSTPSASTCRNPEGAGAYLLVATPAGESAPS